MRLSEGQTLDGRYRLIGLLGSGGMADVWHADDTELGRQVAIKVLHENFARDAEFVERFQREASSAAALQHPNVVGVFDRGRIDDTYYIAMEYVEGSSLRELIDRGLSTTEAVEVARQVLSASEFAHSRGIVHRDLKPLNVLIDRQGRIRVTDFGIASSGGSEITQTGSVMGTSQYLSPEQAQGRDVTAASDIYSIGVVLFEMLTGRVPFDGDNPVAIAMKHVSEPAPVPSSINPDVTPALDAVVLHALAKDPANRYEGAAEMLAALDAAEANPSAGSSTQRHAAYVAPDEEGNEGIDRRWWWALGAVLLLLIGGGLAYALTRNSEATVPGVVGDTEERAVGQLERAGFAVDPDRVESTRPEGTVVSQDPRGGTEAEEGSTVTIEVSLGPPSAPIPDVSGQKEKQARKALEKAGFEIEIEREFSDRVDSGLVIRTEPGAGIEVEQGQTVTMIVSDGTEQVTVPSVVGSNRIDAAATLRDAGFKVKQESQNADAPEDEVVRQIPTAGTALDSGKTVTIVYSTGAGSIVVGDYVGFKQGKAERQIEKLGLDSDVRTEAVESESDDGIVLSQNPNPGSRLSPEDSVFLVVGVFEPPPATPRARSGWRR